ncbi:hypothetical protein [Bartonella sp. CB178]|uniref:hypothetical protein n=1 Tax=Bartonella sp. CB178 TaxID=3112255 RepID=UPI00300E3795
MIAQKRYTNASALLVGYLSHSAMKLLDIHALLLKARKGNVRGEADSLRKIDSAKRQLDEISRALILEYHRCRENELFLKEVLVSISDQLFSLNNDFKETGRLFFQEIRMLQSQMQCFLKGTGSSHLFNDREYLSSPSKIDEIIRQLRKTQRDLIDENPHLFEKECSE